MTQNKHDTILKCPNLASFIMISGLYFFKPMKNKDRLHGLATCVSCNTWKHKKNCLKLISFTHISSTNPFWWNKHIDTVCSHKRTDAKGATKPARLYLCMFYFSQQWAFYRVWTDKRDAFSFSSTSLFQFIQRKEISSAFLHLNTADWRIFFALLFFLQSPLLDWKSGQLN